MPERHAAIQRDLNAGEMGWQGPQEGEVQSTALEEKQPQAPVYVGSHLES